MAIEFTPEELSKSGKKLFVATPMYGGMCAGEYTRSMVVLSSACRAHNIPMSTYYLFNESLITRARNYSVAKFLESDCTHLMFIDSDISFNFVDVFTLLYLCDGADDYGIISGPYPKKTIAWEKVAKAHSEGFGRENPFDLELFGGDFVLNLKENTGSFKLDEPLELMETGTGFMMIHRDVLTKFIKEYPNQKYVPDHTRSADFDGSKMITAFFDTVIDPVSKRYLSEDYMFCQYARKIGVKIWTCPWMRLKHIGTYTYNSDLVTLSQISDSPTASSRSNKKLYQK